MEGQYGYNTYRFGNSDPVRAQESKEYVERLVINQIGFAEYLELIGN